MAAKNAKTPITIMIGGGSKLPKIIQAAKSSTSKFKISLVVSHKKESAGVKLALKNQIPALYLNLVDWRKRTKKSRADYMKYLGWLISQPTYNPKLIVFAGWDLVMDKNFFNFFKANLGDGYAAINLHPALMKTKGEKKITLPDGTTTPVIKGEQEEVMREVLIGKYTFFGPSVHFMIPTKFDTGEVIERSFIKVGSSKTINQLRKKLMPVEVKILLSSIKKVISKQI